MIFIENKFDFLQFLDEYQKHTNKIYVRLSDDDKHVMNNRISFVYIQTPFDEFIINVNNGDGLGIKKEALQKLLDTQKVQLVFNYKAISQILQFKNALDIDMMKFVSNDESKLKKN